MPTPFDSSSDKNDGYNMIKRNECNQDFNSKDNIHDPDCSKEHDEYKNSKYYRTTDECNQCKGMPDNCNREYPKYIDKCTRYKDKCTECEDKCNTFIYNCKGITGATGATGAAGAAGAAGQQERQVQREQRDQGDGVVDTTSMV